MKNRNPLRVLGLWAAIAALGCGGGSGSSSTPQGFAQLYAQKECARFQQCASSDPQAEQERVALAGVACNDANDDTMARYAAYIAAGTLTYDRAAADACLASYGDLCAGGSVSACDQVFVGTVADGGGCFEDIQCRSGICLGSGGSVVVCGTCTAGIAAGQLCNIVTGAPCVKGSYCQFTNSPSFGDGICSAADAQFNSVQVALGEVCGIDFATNTEHPCAPTLYCDATSHCAERRAPGLACDPTLDECRLGSVCADDGTGTTRCFEGTRVSTAGASCGVVASQFVVCDPASRLVCGTSGSCESLGGLGADGDTCEADYQCHSGYCSQDSGQCAPAGLANGAACHDDAQCVSGHCTLTGSTRVCAAVPTCP